MHKNEIEELVNKYLRGSATEEEKQALLKWYRSINNEPLFWELEPGESEEVVRSRIFENIGSEHGRRKPVQVRRNWPKVIAAAVLLMAVTFGLYFHFKPEPPLANAHTPLIDIPAGGSKAILTLADGTRIMLDEHKEGLLARQAGTSINKVSEGVLIYDSQGKIADDITAAALHNTITTPIGGKYQLTLPDGSNVWLNSASSLRFPTSFSGVDREVELTGEAYFEVAKKSGAAFKVKSGKHIVEVLGTHFNVNAYENEPAIRTTLLEGKVRVAEVGSSESVVLAPGEQSRWGKDLFVHKVDSQVAIAWKEGYFRFENADIKSVMRQLSRWYGVTVRSEGKISTQTYGGAIDMDLSLLQVLEILENGKVNFKLEGKELIVMP